MNRSRAATKRSWLQRGSVAAGALAAVMVLVTISSTIEPDGVEPRISDPVDVTAAPATTVPPPTTSAPEFPIVAGIDAEGVTELTALPHPGANVLTADSLTPGLISDIHLAVAGLDLEEPPLQVVAAFEKDGVIRATVDLSSGEIGNLVVENGAATRFRHNAGPWIDVYAIRKTPTDYFGFTQISWLGLPEEAATARLTTPERSDDIADQTVIGSATFFEIRKPDWNQIGTLTLFDVDGNQIMTEEMRLDGRTCSSSLAGPVTAALPESDLTTGRLVLADALYSCTSVTVARLAEGSGPYFDLPMEDLAESLHEADLRTGLFSTMLYALKTPPREVEDGNETLYVFRWNNAATGHRVELGFTNDGIWQYGQVEQIVEE